jgi:hypothetical protein
VKKFETIAVVVRGENVVGFVDEDTREPWFDSICPTKEVVCACLMRGYNDDLISQDVLVVVILASGNRCSGQPSSHILCQRHEGSYDYEERSRVYQWSRKKRQTLPTTGGHNT